MLDDYFLSNYNKHMKNLRWTGDIGYRNEETKNGISLSFVESELQAAGGEDITVELDSFGGDFFVGIQIMTMIKAYKGNSIVNYGSVVASAATAVAAGFKKRVTRKTSSFMIHNAMTFAYGDQNEFRKTADQLDAWSSMIAEIYAEITGKPIEEIKTLMDQETWLYGQEILDSGFANEMDAIPVSNWSKETIKAQYQKKIKNYSAEPKARPKTVREFEEFLRDAGFSKIQACAIASAGRHAIADKEVEKVTKQEILDEIKAQGVTLKEVANYLGQDSQLQDEKILQENVSMKATLASLEADRLAISLNKEFGQESETNLVRAQAKKVFLKISDVTPEAIEAFKADPVTKTLAANIVDHNSGVNLLDHKDGKPVPVKTVGGVTVMEV